MVLEEVCLARQRFLRRLPIRGEPSGGPRGADVVDGVEDLATARGRCEGRELRVGGVAGCLERPDGHRGASDPSALVRRLAHAWSQRELRVEPFPGLQFALLDLPEMLDHVAVDHLLLAVHIDERKVSDAG